MTATQERTVQGKRLEEIMRTAGIGLLNADGLDTFIRVCQDMQLQALKSQATKQERQPLLDMGQTTPESARVRPSNVFGARTPLSLRVRDATFDDDIDDDIDDQLRTLEGQLKKLRSGIKGKRKADSREDEEDHDRQFKKRKPTRSDPWANMKL